MLNIKMKPIKHSYPTLEQLEKQMFNIYNSESRSRFNNYHTPNLRHLDHHGNPEYKKSGNNYAYYFSELKIIRLVNIHKVNAKYKKTYYKSGVNKGKYKSSKLIRKKEWIVYVYDVPIDMIKYITQYGKYVITQKPRNFTITKVVGK